MILGLRTFLLAVTLLIVHLTFPYSINLTFSSWFCCLLRHKVTDFIQGGDLQQTWQETGNFCEELIQIYVAEVALVLGKIFKLVK